MPFEQRTDGLWRELDTGRLYGGTQDDAELQHERWRLRRTLNHDGLRMATVPQRGSALDGLEEYKPIPDSPRRRLIKPVFKLDITTVEDAILRLAGSIVYVGPEPVTVIGAGMIENRLYLSIRTHTNTNYRIAYDDPKLDLRGAEPQYIVYDHNPVFLYRTSARQQKQGMDPHNTLMKHVGQGHTFRYENTTEVCRGLKDQNTLKWSSQFADLMTNARAFRSLRLSSRVAFFVKQNVVTAEYLGRHLGPVLDDAVHIDPADHKPWIVSAVDQIGCKLK
jgi:hypothetical protein